MVDEPLKPGIYDAVAAGYFVLLRGLTPSTYRIVFGSEGPGKYATRSVYDLVAFMTKEKDFRIYKDHQDITSEQISFYFYDHIHSLQVSFLFVNSIYPFAE